MKLAGPRLAFWVIQIAGILFVLGFCLMLAGCVHKPAPIITPQSLTETKSQSAVAAAVNQALADAAKLDLGPVRQSLELLLRIALAGLPVPSSDDVARMAEVSKLVFAGKVPEAEAKAHDYSRELTDLRKQLERERADSAEQIRKLLADAEARIKAAEDAGTRKAFLIMITFAAATGGLISIGGALMAWMTSYKLVGAALILAGPCVPGSALLWGRPWFYIPAGLGILLVGLALGIKCVWAILDRDGNGRVDMLEKKNPA